MYRGHTAPVTTLSITEDPSDPRAPPFLISGSWDKVRLSNLFLALFSYLYLYFEHIDRKNLGYEGSY